MRTKTFIWKGRIVYFSEDLLADRNINYRKPTFVCNDFSSFLKANLFRVVNIEDGMVKCRVLEEEK